MTTPKSWTVRGIVALVAFVLFAPLACHADTYQILNLSSGNVAFLGLSPTGLAYFYDSYTYLTYSNGAAISNSIVAPTFTADNGTSCTPSVPAGGTVARGICNNGRDVFTGKLTSGQAFTALYSGPTFQSLFGGSGGSPFTPYPNVLAMNSLGDIIFDDEANEIWYEAIDLTTAPVPEPNSFLLFGTGALALAAFVAFRRNVHA